MKKIHTRTIFQKVVLGFFLGIFLFSGGGVSAEGVKKCSELTAEGKSVCKTRYDCRWHEEWEDYEGTVHPKGCFVGAETCRSVNHKGLTNVEKKKVCTDTECWWKENPKNPEKGVCRPVKGACEGKMWLGCLADSDCRWYQKSCLMRAGKQHEKAVRALDGICNCKSSTSKNKVPVWQTEGEVCGSKRNEFWIEEIPPTCTQPVTNEGVKWFCDSNVGEMTSYGKKQCRNGIKHVIKAGEQKCLDESEMRFQGSLRNSAAREQRRADDAACRENTIYLYSGPIFEGGGLRSGAILAHENLTKSISHSTDLKELIINWTKFILEIIAVIAVIAVVWAGILYITDMGDGGNIEKAKKILIWVAVGIFVILGSYAIVNTLMKADFGSNRAEITTSFYG